MVVALLAAAGVLSAGFVTGFDKDESVESTVQGFLLDWQQGNYSQAAAFTTGSHTAVAAQLAAAYGDLNATASFLSLGHIRQHGSTADAEFTATVDLDQGRHQWTYNGHFELVSRHGDWFVEWSPSVINPSLGPGERLAVATSFPARAQIVDHSGKPLLPKSADYQIGVYPGRLANAARTVKAFTGIAQLDNQQVLGEVRAAPPGDFLSLLTLDHATFRSLWPRLSRVPGVSFQRKSERLFAGNAVDVTGDVGTENSDMLRSAGVAYEPGDTVGLSGLEQTYQDDLVGTPTTSVVVVGPDGRDLTTLWTSQGHSGTPVKTTLSSQDQTAAARTLAGRSGSGEIVAVDSATGDILALATHPGAVALPPGGPLNARIAPGMAFSIVSAAAMVGAGVQPSTPLPCHNSEAVGGQTFTYTGQKPSATFASDFANGCGTAFASMSTKLTPAQLAAEEKSFGIGANWDLQLRAFSGSAQSASSDASLAAQAIGTSGVLMSPLGMALVAAEVDAGTGHTPALVASDPAAQWQAPLSGAQLGELRQLMRGAVTSGSARAANIPGKSVYGQAGVVQTGKHAWLSWFVGYRGGVAVTVLQTGATPQQAAASLAGSFLSSVG
ncbi:MAG TPA: penicillin-binding transpeptidase domain-containing protein [Streptosporangiaceae bacterium]